MLSTRPIRSFLAVRLDRSQIHHAGAVNDDRVAAVEGGRIARQISCDSLEVGRVPRPWNGVLGGKVLVYLAELANAGHTGLDITRGNRVGADPVLSEPDRHRPDHGSQGCF